MIIDLSADRVLTRLVERCGLVVNDAWAFGHPWRHLLLADLDPGFPVRRQARDLLIGHLDGKDVRLRPDPWPALNEMPAEGWRGRVRNAATTGLAYGIWSSTERDRAARSDAMDEFLHALTAMFVEPLFLSNVLASENAWTPVSDHTFDAVFVIHDSRRLAVALAVDED